MLADRSRRRRDAHPCEFRACRYGVGETLTAALAAIGGTTATTAGTTAATTAALSTIPAATLTGTTLTSGLVGSALSVGAGTGSGLLASGTLGAGSALAAGGAATTAASTAATTAASTIPAVAAGAQAIPATAGGPTSAFSPATVQSLLTAGKVVGDIVSGAGTAAKVAMPLLSATNSIVAGQQGKKSSQAAAKQAQARANAEVADSSARARAVLAANDVTAAASGVVGGSGSVQALQRSNLVNAGADVAAIRGNANLYERLYRGRGKDALYSGYGRAAGSFFDAGASLTDAF